MGVLRPKRFPTPTNSPKKHHETPKHRGGLLA